MKGVLRFILVAIYLFAVRAQSAPVVIDSFSEGGFSLAFRVLETDVDLIAETLVNRRRVTGIGEPFWTANLDSSVGILRYDVDVSIPPSEETFLTLDYRNTNGTFSIAAFDAFLLEIPELNGSGYLRVAINDLNLGFSLPELITEAGLLRYPFENMTVGNYGQPINSVQFYFFPISTEFSVGVNEIAVVPEPAGAILLITGSAMLALKRRRLVSNVDAPDASSGA